MNSAKILDASAVNDEKDELTLVDVRLADDFSAGHLPGAESHCAFEVSFLDRKPGREGR